MTRHILAATALALTLPFAFAPSSAHAQIRVDDFSRGGPAGCYDPRRVRGQDREQMEALGGRPCPGTQTQRQASPPLPPARWETNLAYQWAYVRSNENPNVIAILSCGEMDDTVAAFSIGVAKSAGAAVERQVFGGTPQRTIRLFVVVENRNPDWVFGTDGKSPTYGESVLKGRNFAFSGGRIDTSDVRALSIADTIKVRLAGNVFTFNGAGSSRALGQLPCGGKP